MKKPKSILRAIAGVAIAAAFSLSYAQQPGASKRILGYYINWGMYAAHNLYSPQDIPWTKITHINYPFAQINSGAWTIEGTDDWADIQCGPQQNGQIGQINALKTQYGVKTLISVGGWTRSGNFSPMAATAQGRAAFAQDCARYIKQYGFDGVDIDWEYPCYVRAPDPNLTGDEGCSGVPADETNYTLLLQQLRHSLDSAGQVDGTTYYLSVAAPGGYDKIVGPVTFQDPQNYIQYLDWMNVMTYDFHGDWDTITGHLAALYPNPADPAATTPVDIKDKYNADAIISFYESKGVPASKINIGAAYYGRSWKNVNNNGTAGLFQPGTARDFYETPWNYGVEPFYTLKPWESDPGYVHGYDSIAQAPYLYDATGKLFYTYDNEQSITAKCNYMAAKALGGIFFWDFTGDYPINGSTLTNLIYSTVSSGSASVNREVAQSQATPAMLTACQSNGQLIFTKQDASPLSVSIFDVNGRCMDSFIFNRYTTVRHEHFPAGEYFCTWGRNQGTIQLLMMRR